MGVTESVIGCGAAGRGWVTEVGAQTGGQSGGGGGGGVQIWGVLITTAVADMSYH